MISETSRRLARLARSVPGAGLAEIAAVGGCDETTARRLLGELPTRGRCSEIAAVIAGSDDTVAAVAAVRHHAFSPAAAVAASQHRCLAVLCSAGNMQRRWQAAMNTSDDGNNAAARHRGCPAGLLRDVTRSPYDGVAFAAAGNPACPPAVLVALALSHVTNAAAGNPACPPAGVVAAVTVGGPRFAAAGNPACPPAVLAALVKSPHEEPVLRREAAGNPSCPPEARTHRPVAVTDWEKVDELKADAADEACPAGTLHRLGSCASFGVRRAVASNPNCPPRTLVSLVADIDEDVRAAAAGNLRLAPETLAVLIKDRNWRVREAAAGNPAIDLAVLAGAVSSDDPYTRRGAAKNPSCSLRMLVELTDDHESGARDVAAAALAALPVIHLGRRDRISVL